MDELEIIHDPALLDADLLPETAGVQKFDPSIALGGLFSILKLGNGPIRNAETQQSALDYMTKIAEGTIGRVPTEALVEVMKPADVGKLQETIRRINE